MKTNEMIHRLFYVVVLALFFAGCDIIDHPLIEYGVYREDLYGPAPAFPPTAEPHQRVLLEDFTGHECGNCPVGHSIAATALADHPEDVVVVAIHAGSLAQSFPPDYPDDWTTPEGQYFLLDQVGVDEMPKGRVNRRPAASTIYSPTVWINKVNEALTLTPAVNLQVTANYVAANNHLNVHAFSEWFSAMPGNYRLVILISESHIVAPQLWYNHEPEFVAEYEHEHMLRQSVTGATGLEVAIDPQAGDAATNSYTIDWNSNWIPENCEVVAYITNGELGEILNVAKVNVVL